MDVLRNAARVAISLAFFCQLFAVPALAGGSKEIAAPAECRGTDMLAELATTDPDSHKRVFEQAAQLENSEALLWRIEKAGSVTIVFVRNDPSFR